MICLTGIPLVREQDGLGSVGPTEFAARRYRRSRTGILPVLACFLPAGPAGCIPVDLKFQTIWRTETVLPASKESANRQSLYIILIFVVGEGVALFLDDRGGGEPKDHTDDHEQFCLGKTEGIKEMQETGGRG